MSKATPKSVDNMGVDDLERKVDQLISLVNRLWEENNALRARENELLTERSELIERNEIARMRVESIITRLKDMEQHEV